METVSDVPGLFARFLAPYTQPTRGQYWAVLLAWWQWCLQAQITVLDAQRVHIEQWIKAQRDQGLRPSTVNTKLTVICGFYAWAFQERLIDRDEAALVRRPHRPRRSRLKYLTKPQVNAFLQASLRMGAPASGLTHLLALNGLRLGETIRARIEHLDTTGSAWTLTLPDRKGGVMDTVGLPAPTVSALSECIGKRSRGRILMSGGRVLTPSRVYTIFNALSDDAGLPFRVRPHMLRATFVTLSLEAGIPARDVMASTGHATTLMVDYYDRAYASVRRNASYRLTDWLQE